MTEAWVETRVLDGRVCIELSGEIDLDNAAAVQEEINAAVGNEVAAVVVDLTRLSYLDSAGLRVLFQLGERMRVLQMELELVVPSRSPVRRVIELSGLSPVARMLFDDPS
ncbi:STAS domain-containing protein [Amycolatopsis cynarae]|uniref:Anti-sigma factor antagonist n=1 Tax=Amycolatopsis cynarae TaxID=2995223 RepID=A0ABY7AZC3_9PSEU|nr:STAS domain-containing protein [Amycolatopsis sp. HUAS 11-8]WAL64554.1 STAS domain-containing protein [Amycolatopsis sp. HUAS 11-8]